MTDALSLLEDHISELNKESTQEQQDPQLSPEKGTEQQAKLQLNGNEPVDIEESKTSQTSNADGHENNNLNNEDTLPKGLLPPERRDEISDQVDKLDGLTSDKNLKMKREWIIREKGRLDEIEALKDMAREAEKRRKRYLSLRHVLIIFAIIRTSSSDPPFKKLKVPTLF